MAGTVSDYAMESAYKDAERDALTRTQAQARPKAVLLGGQPGSGKSALAAEAVREFRDQGGAVVIDADRMREENPRYKQLSIEDPQHAADRTQREAGEWATRLTIAAAENHRNLVVDGTMRDPANVRELTERLKEHGYEVEARVMAVNPEISITRARLRFEEQVAERGTGRFVNQEQHDNAYRGMAASVASLERDKLVDSVRVYDANQRPLYENRLERGEWQRAPEAARVLEAERTRAWTHAERRDYVSALEDITALARQRERIPEHVTYAVGAPGRESVEYATPRAAAEAFARAPAEDRPFIIRTERGPDGRESGSIPGQTSVTEKDGVRSYGKWVGGTDVALKREYEDAQNRMLDAGREAREAQSDRKPMASDLDALLKKLDAAREDLARFEQTAVYQRAQAFDQLSKREALERHPDLDGAYKQLHDLKQGWTPQASQTERESSYFTARAALSEQLHRGELPKGNVTREESERIIGMAAQHRGLMVRDAGELKQDFRGEVVANSSQHTLVKISDMVAVRYERANLDRDLQVGEKVAIQYSNDKSRVHEHSHVPARESGKDMAHEIGGR